MHSGGGDTRSVSGKSASVGCAASGIAGPPKIPAICTGVGVGCGLELTVDTQEILVGRGIENGSSCLVVGAHPVDHRRVGPTRTYRSELVVRLEFETIVLTHTIARMTWVAAAAPE